MKSEIIREREESGLSKIVRRFKSPSPQPSPGVPGEGARTAGPREWLQRGIRTRRRAVAKGGRTGGPGGWLQSRGRTGSVNID